MVKSEKNPLNWELQRVEDWTARLLKPGILPHSFLPRRSLSFDDLQPIVNNSENVSRKKEILFIL